VYTQIEKTIITKTKSRIIPQIMEVLAIITTTIIKFHLDRKRNIIFTMLKISIKIKILILETITKVIIR